MNTATATHPVTTIEHEVKQALTLRMPDEERNARRAGMFLELVNSFDVATPSDFEGATGELRDIKAVYDAMEADRVSFTGPLNAVLDKINARFQPHLKTLKSAEAILKGKMGGFLQAEQARAAAESAEAERRAEAESQRLLAEAAELRATADAAPVAERRKAEAQAQALEQTAAVLTAQAAPLVSSSRSAGLSTPKTVTFELTDLLAVVQHIASKRPDLVVLVKLDEPKVRAMVKMLGMNTAIPGVRVFEKLGITVR